MYDHEQQVDHDEHAAVEAEQQAEREAEQAHDDTVDRLVADLYGMGVDARNGAISTLGRMVSEVDLRLPPNAHRVELLAQQQHVAALAPLVAAGLDTGRPYGLVEAAQAIVSSYLVTHSTGRDDQLGRAIRRATSRVLTAVEAAQPARSAEHEAAAEARDGGAL